MHLVNRLYQSRRDFQGTFACSHCGKESVQWGYDDANFHHNVIPKMECPHCGLTGGGTTSSPIIPAGLNI